MVVMKFGGTSVADASAVSRLVGFVKRQMDSQAEETLPPVIVISALAGVTRQLMEVSRLFGEGSRLTGRI
ncbi:MAG: hypothetical protein K2Q26_15925, partial [Bdellovibrionales bacterium]|nr:hypothetical protein [Bdellovibrionales bacterium]